MSDFLLSKEKHHVGVITLNRPEALHALNHEMILRFSSLLDEFQKNPLISLILIKANPSRAFCAGGDIRALWEIGQTHPEQAFSFFQDEYALNYKIGTLKKPYVALMNGYTLGGGVGISLHGQYAIASEHFRFGMPETSIGFFTDIGSSYLFSQLPEAYSNYLALTGLQIGPEDALYLNLIDAIVPEKDFSAIEDLIYHNQLDFAIKKYQTKITEPAWFETHHHALITCFDQPTVPDIFKQLERFDTDWSKNTLALLHSKSPTSLYITFELLKRTRQKSLADCLNLDQQLVQHFLKSHDLYEGIRAQLIDKDRSPNWSPKIISQALIEDYFSIRYTL